MAFPASPTFEQIRDEVLIELSLNRSGNVRKHILDQVERYIKSEHRMIYIRLEAARRNVVFNITTTAGQNNYEFPDQTYVGDIEFMWAVNNDDEISEIVPIINPRSLDPENQSEGGPPAHWWIENEQLYVGPAPSDSWPTISIQAKQREQSFNKGGDRCQVDPELLILRATIRGLRFFEQHAEADRLEATATLYEQDVRGYENRNAPIVLGQHTQRYPTQVASPYLFSLHPWSPRCNCRNW